MSAPVNSRELRNAKKKAIENAVWLPKPTKKARQAPQAPSGLECPAKKISSLSTNKHQRSLTNSEEEEEDGGHFKSSGSETDLEPVKSKPRGLYRPNKLRRTYAMQDVSVLVDTDELDSDGDQVDHPVMANGGDTDEESEHDEPETTAMMLADEIPSLVTDSMKPKRVVQTHGKSQSARDQKHAAEIPTWRDVDNAVSESEETTTAGSEPSEPYSSEFDGPKKLTSATHSAQTMAALIRTEKGNIKLLNQNHQTQRVVRNAILDAKCHVIFVNAYPELVDKNQISLQSLLTVAQNLDVPAIKQHLQTDAQYAAHLSSLVEPRIPLLRRDLKITACANIDGYFRLGQNIVKARKLMEQHAYVYALKFDTDDDASPIRKKPYQGDLLIFLLYDGVFDGAKSIGVKYAGRFGEIASNKGNRPKIPIPLLALVATAVYAALFWKTLGSPGKFNFTGNQFSETYVFHVKFLEKLKKDAPAKFHCMMADIYEAIQALKRKGNDHLASEHQDALALLDLDGMAEDYLFSGNIVRLYLYKSKIWQAAGSANLSKGLS
ncbi:uncharacterized protein HD556DRAFT_1302543 [Suillus plorans]|uniref:DUF6532 domain-containing protein n=1 Tax=Suillus plorans TaxID=116603 RepID=A0A9P7E3T2_9AGAM|nr:uncharacterized protein HD556DRAFT_1302543 [Suillus plorans]KAG1810189.1 hypothetical protein HD556DRAFT_1302543 [Suillus plorans]